MESKSFKFETGVTISIGTKEITAKDKSGEDKMDSVNLDSFTFEQFAEPRISPSGLSSIPLVLGLLIVVFGGGDGTPFFYLGILILIFGIVALVFTVIEAMLEGNISRQLIAKFYAHKGYAITIGNKSGNNIQFVADLNELSKIKEVEKQLDELKQHLFKVESAKPQQTTVIQNESSNLDELKKLGELLEAKVITQEEFDQKKKELLK